MPRPVAATTANPQLSQFAADLQIVRQDAGAPTYRRMAAAVDHPASALSRAAAGRTVPSWTCVEKFLQGCSITDKRKVDRWKRRWAALRTAAVPDSDRPADPSAMTPPAENDATVLLTKLSPPTRHMLQVASIIGPSFRLPQLAQLMQCRTATLLPALDEALRSGLLVVATGSGSDFLAFDSISTHRTAEASLPRPAVLALRAELLASRTGGDSSTDRDRATNRRAGGLAGLTERESAVAQLAGRSLTNQQIASRLGISPHTVNYHLRQIFRKLAIGSRVELASLTRDRWQRTRR